MTDENISKVSKTLELMIKRLKKIGAESDLQRVQNWLAILQTYPSDNDLNRLWREIQLVGRQMGYMDYLDDDYREISRELTSQMLELIINLRRSTK